MKSCLPSKQPDEQIPIKGSLMFSEGSKGKIGKKRLISY